jgi:hypothetical protein
LDATVVAEISKHSWCENGLWKTLSKRDGMIDYGAVMSKYQSHSNRDGAAEMSWPISTLQEQKLFQLMLSDHVTENGEVHYASDQASALPNAHLSFSEDRVRFFELLYGDESIKWDLMRLQ